MNPMAEVMRYRKIKAQADGAQSVQRAVDGALSCLTMGGNPRVKRDVAQAALLGSPWMWNGQSLRVNGKSVGAGVWELYIETNATRQTAERSGASLDAVVGRQNQEEA